MRIGVNARLLSSGRLEGIGRFTIETLWEMFKNHSSDEFVLFFDRKPESLDLIKDFPNVTYKVLNLPTRHPILIIIWFEALLRKALEKEEIEVFYSADNFLSLSSGVKTVLVCHDLAYLSYPQGLRWDYLWFYKTFMPLYLKKAARIITVSEFVKGDVVKNFGIEESLIDVAYNALPSRVHKPENKQATLSSMQPYFIYVGSLHPRKNIVGLIQAFIQLKQKHEKVNLVLVGRLAWKSEEIRRLLKTEGVQHLEGIEDDILMHYISKAKAMVYPSFSEGFGIPILEGFAAGVPVITSKVTSMPEVAGSAAILVNPHNVDEISSAMEKVLSDEELCQQLVSEGKSRLQSFSWAESARKIYESFKQTLSD